jgi:hypothetical protein
MNAARTSQQNRIFHALISDIAQQLSFAGRRWKAESWKRLIIESFINVERNEAIANGNDDPFPGLVMLVEGIDGETVVQLGQQTRKLTRAQMANLCEATFAYGAERGVEWSTLD